MLIDVTLEITPQMAQDARGNERKALSGHLGTHFDVMDKEFPLAYTCRPGVVFDVRAVRGRDIGLEDVDLTRVDRGMFVAFCSGFLTEQGYGGKTYFSAHPQLSHALIDALLDRGVSILGVDFAGVRRGAEHTPTDQRCADRGAFVVENLWGLEQILAHGPDFTAHTYPLRCAGATGLPCRVVAEL